MLFFFITQLSGVLYSDWSVCGQICLYIEHYIIYLTVVPENIINIYVYLFLKQPCSGSWSLSQFFLPCQSLFCGNAWLVVHYPLFICYRFLYVRKSGISQSLDNVSRMSSSESDSSSSPSINEVLFKN